METYISTDRKYKTCSDGQYKKTVDNSLLMNTLGDIEFTNIDVGIKSSVEWVINNLNLNIRL